ncbi:DNA polymerase III subunit delta [Mycoplasma elephantis]|uniref:DNA polymerase III subunit delta n=1 Tax=Mycoplasma elephantis TaxID=114882 RepID=UPI0004863B14|nr:DNA polymerase III subunit delta [Mycoplasma elephantis]
MYLIYGEDKYLIETKVNSIIEEYNKKFDDSSVDILKFNQEINEDDFLFQLENNPIFIEHRIFVCNNLSFLTNNSKNVDKLNKIIELLKNRKATHIIFIINSMKLPESNILIDFLKEKANVLLIKSLNDNFLAQWIKNFVEQKNGKISDKNIDILLNYLPHDLLILSKEINKLMDRNKEIRIDPEIDFPSYLNKNPYSIQNFLENKDVVNFVSECKKTIEIEGDTSKLVKIISSFFTLASQYYCFIKAGFNENQIQEALQIHPYRVFVANKIVSSYGIKKINNIIKELGNIEINSRTTNIGKERWFDYFLIKYMDIVYE